MTMWEDWLPKKERKTAREGTQEPLKKTAREGTPSTQERNSQGGDPRTLEESSEGGNVSTHQINSNPKRSAKHAYHTGISAWSIARTGISCTTKQRSIGNALNIRWTSFQSLSMSSRREDLMDSDMGKSQETRISSG